MSVYEGTSEPLAGEILDRIKDIVEEDANEAGVALMLASLRVFSRNYPRKLDAQAKRKIKENYPSATPELMSLRAMADEGVQYVVATARQVARIAIDYNPNSHTKSIQDADMALGEKTLKAANKQISDTFDVVHSSGMSAFGTAATMILLSIVKAQSTGVNNYQLIKVLLDGLGQALGAPSDNAGTGFDEEAAVAFIANQMGISMASARKYVKEAKKTILGQ